MLSEKVSAGAAAAVTVLWGGARVCRILERGISMWKFMQSRPMMRPCSPVMGMVQERRTESDLFLL